MPYRQLLHELAGQIADRLGFPWVSRVPQFELNEGYLGQGYGIPGKLEREAISLLARSEGVLLDPVYTGRAMGGLLDMVRSGIIAASETVLFWHTGGSPAIFAYPPEIFL